MHESTYERVCPDFISKLCINSSFRRKTVQLRTDGSSMKSAVTSIWGPKSLDNIVDLDLSFEVETEKSVLRRLGNKVDSSRLALKLIRSAIHISLKSFLRNQVIVQGLISKFTVGGGRTGTDRQFFFVNGRPCNPSKVQRAFNEVYRTFNANQSPFIVADFILPRGELLFFFLRSWM